MGTPLAPLLQHDEWKPLLRAFTKAHRAFDSVASHHIATALAPAASVALWLLKEAPALLHRPRLHLVTVEPLHHECVDTGRWYQFIPWLAGVPQLQVRVDLAGGKALRPALERRDAPVTRQTIEASLATRMAPKLTRMAPATVLAESLPAWREQGHPEPDLYVLFRADFAEFHAPFLADACLGRAVREGTPVATFCYSTLDQHINHFLLSRAYGLELETCDGWDNPWVLPNLSEPGLGCVGARGWRLQAHRAPAVLQADTTEIERLLVAMQYAETDLKAYGDVDFVALGRVIHTATDQGNGRVSQDTLYQLPGPLTVDACTGTVLEMVEDGAYELDLQIPQECLRRYPAAGGVLERVLWAIEAHQRHVAPYVALEGQAQ